MFWTLSLAYCVFYVSACLYRLPIWLYQYIAFSYHLLFRRSISVWTWFVQYPSGVCTLWYSMKWQSTPRNKEPKTRWTSLLYATSNQIIQTKSSYTQHFHDAGDLQNNEKLTFDFLFAATLGVTTYITACGGSASTTGHPLSWLMSISMRRLWRSSFNCARVSIGAFRVSARASFCARRPQTECRVPC